VPDFPYINARVRAMRGRLLAPAQLDDLLAAASLPAFLQALAATPYAHDLQEALTRYEGVRAVDEALARNLQRTTRSILKFADGPAHRLITILLLRWDLANVRAIVRGRHAGRSAAEILEAVIPAGTLSEGVLKEMAGAPTMAAVAGTLEVVHHPLAEALAVGAGEYATTGDPLAIELRLERAYADHVLRQTRGRGDAVALRESLTAEIDAANVKTALKVAPAGLPKERRLGFFIPGGALVTEKLFLNLSDESTQAAAWAHMRAQGFPVKEPPRNLVAFERVLDAATAGALARRYLHGDPLGLDIVMGYLVMKSAEVANLRLIARGKLLGLPREQVRREMVVV
jgi:V/A-type H+-transporting ATPase subunit C